MKRLILIACLLLVAGCEQKIEQAVEPVIPRALNEPCSIESMIDQHKHEFEFFYTKTTGTTMQVYGINPIGKPDPHLLCTKETAIAGKGE